MRVFVTGASGFIGKDVVKELLNTGHQVVGLARSEASANIVTKLGAEPLLGDIEDLSCLKRGAEASDGVIHLAWINDFKDFARVAKVDKDAIEAMGEALAGTGKPLVIASGTMISSKGVLSTEDSEPDRSTPFAVRALSADAVYEMSKGKQVRGSVVRLAPTVHGAGDHGFITMFINLARKNGVAAYIGDGSARWPAVHRTDAAVLFRLALEKGRPGATYNAVAEQGVPMKEIMTLIAKRLDLPVEGKTPEELVQAMGMLGHVVGMDNPTSSEKTRKELGWEPTEPELLTDMGDNYFS